MQGVYCILVCFLVSFVCALDLTAPAINLDLIAAVNANPKSTWVAGANKRFEGWNLADFSRLLGVKESSKKFPVKSQPSMAVPTAFDARQNWPGCIGPVLDQGHCGSCWAFGAVESLQDRFCIQSKGVVNISLSEQMVVSCDDTNDGCDGGDIMAAWQYLVQSGTVTTACYPYAMGTCHHPGCSEWSTPSCNATCQNGDKFNSYYHYAASAYAISSAVTDIQTEILKNGPVEVTMAVYEDFANYKSGVYAHHNGTLLGYHAIKNVGWGVTSAGVEYWIIQNSWNTGWGMEGFFLIQRGVDECGIESDVVAGLAKL